MSTDNKAGHPKYAIPVDQAFAIIKEADKGKSLTQNQGNSYTGIKGSSL